MKGRNYVDHPTPDICGIGDADTLAILCPLEKVPGEQHSS